MKPRTFELKNLLRNHGHELVLAVALTLVGVGALVASRFGFV